MPSPFKYFDSSPEVIRLVVMMYVRYPLSLRNVEDLLAERGIDICHETVRLWWNRFGGPVFAAEIKKRRRLLRRGCPEWRWHLDEVFVKINGKTHYLWRVCASAWGPDADRRAKPLIWLTARGSPGGADLQTGFSGPTYSSSDSGRRRVWDRS
jgi:hypothetical protein